MRRPLQDLAARHFGVDALERPGPLRDSLAELEGTLDDDRRRPEELLGRRTIARHHDDLMGLAHLVATSWGDLGSVRPTPRRRQRGGY